MTALSELMDDAGVRSVSLVLGETGTGSRTDDLVRAGARSFSEDAAGDRVGILMTNDAPTVQVLLGAVTEGSTLVSLPLPGRGADVEAYAAFLTEVCRTQELSEVVVADQHAELLEGIGIRVRRHSELGDRPLAAPSAEGFRLVQFTSGSTGAPRPVVVDDARLGANVEAILEVVQPRPGDAVVSWLPLSHDMGLVGMLLAGLVGGSTRRADGGDIVLLDPTTFLRDPKAWLAALDRWTGSVSASPDFGLRLALRRRSLGAVDLSSLRCLILGGEIVRADTLEDFSSACRPHGLGDAALCPAYGMAEAGLAVTLTPPAERWRSVTVSTSALADGVRAPATSEDDSTVLVASGPPLPGYAVDCAGGADGAGAIRVQGPSFGVDGTTGRPFAGTDGYETGDVGFLDDGSLFVCGRTDDYFVAYGRNVYAPAVEAAVGDVPGVRSGRVTAVGLPSGTWTIVAEPEADRGAGTVVDRPAREVLVREVRRAAARAGSPKPDEVLLVRPGSMPFTSSGKVQRAHVRRSLLAGRLDPLDDPDSAAATDVAATATR